MEDLVLIGDLEAVVEAIVGNFRPQSRQESCSTFRFVSRRSKRIVQFPRIHE
jgi:hypothetical protein